MASQEAIVIKDEAVIYSDKYMSAPLGFVKRGKVVKVGDIPRNKAQVYPIAVSGKIAYIRAVDISLAKESMQSKQLVGERFQTNATKKRDKRSSLSVAYLNYTSQVKLTQTNDTLKDNDIVSWNGVSLKGDKEIDANWDLQILTNFLVGNKDSETFRIYELGAGAANRIFEKSKFLVKLEGQFLAIPFATYSIANDVRVNGYGYTLGGGLNFTYFLGANWGLEGFGGLYYTKLMGFQNMPAPYSVISPSFTGMRLGLGINYRL